MTSELEKVLQACDGLTISPLSEARAACRNTPGFLASLLMLCSDPRPNIAIGATWILKAELEDGAMLAPALTMRLIEALDHLQPWQAKLHICQSVDRLELTTEQAGRMIEWASALADHPRPFVRAWSCHVRVVLGRSFADYRQDAALALAAAESDTAASVRARARRLRAEKS